MHNEEKYKIYHRITGDGRSFGYHLPRRKSGSVKRACR